MAEMSDEEELLRVFEELRSRQEAEEAARRARLQRAAELRAQTAIAAGVSAYDGRGRIVPTDTPIGDYPAMVDELYACINALARKVRALEAKR